YKPVAEFPAMRRRIDAAAEAAGRRPADIRGILNLNIRLGPAAQPEEDVVTGSAEQAVSQLRYLLSLGFTGFNFLAGPDQRDAMQRIAAEVLPALRSTG
ncbi:MAG: LLM class flavin-dependent oxidoreductase, partial [Actinobacteria bacterium]|nr:LLM class flavin-dependent oxidoreductase [Actinomycetota bacterium]